MARLFSPARRATHRHPGPDPGSTYTHRHPGLDPGSILITAASFGLFAMTPANPAILPLVILNVAVSATFIFALSGIYFALLEEGGIPLVLTGTAAGVASAIGFIPDVYMPVVGGYLLDSYPGVLGYRLLFAFVAVLSVLGLIATLLIMRMQKSR